MTGHATETEAKRPGRISRGLRWTLLILLLLVPGLGGVIGGVIAIAVSESARDVNEQFVGDDDGDGKVDEDGPYDADNSANDATQVSGIQEANDHRDDDSDGRVDEDPPPQEVVEAASKVANNLAVAAIAIGSLLLVVFGFFAWGMMRR